MGAEQDHHPIRRGGVRPEHTIDERRAQTAQLRTIDLADVLERLGGEHDRYDQRDRYDRHTWHLGGEHISGTGERAAGRSTG